MPKNLTQQLQSETNSIHLFNVVLFLFTLFWGGGQRECKYGAFRGVRTFPKGKDKHLSSHCFAVQSSSHPPSVAKKNRSAKPRVYKSCHFIVECPEKTANKGQLDID